MSLELLGVGLADSIPFSIGPADAITVSDAASGAGRGGKAAPSKPSMATAPPPKVIALRIFDDDAGRFARSLADVGGGLLVVSQFTLYADCRKGRRPSFADAASAPQAEALYESFVARAREGRVPVATGQFGARMAVALVNDGPVTLVVDTAGDA